MRRFIVERAFARDLVVPVEEAGRRTCASIAAVNAVFGVTWICSYVSTDRRRSWCLYESPSADAIRLAAERNGLPVYSITEVWRVCAEGEEPAPDACAPRLESPPALGDNAQPG